MAVLEFYFDVASPYSYLASTQVDAIAADCGAQLVYKPFLLGAVFKAAGVTPPGFVVARFKYLAKDLGRWAKYYGVPMAPVMPIANSLLPMRVLAGSPADRLAENTTTMFRTWWVEGRDVTEASVLTEVFGEAAVARAADPAVKELLKANTDEAVARGAFGAPTFFIGDKMYFGNDRLPFVEQELRRNK